MESRISPWTVLTSALALVALGCEADIHDNTIPINIDNAEIDVSADGDFDQDNVKPGQTVNLNLTVKNVDLVDPKATPPKGKESTAGHIQVYIDDTDHDPILITATTKIQVKIPDSLPQGDHKLICRVHKHDGTPTNVVKEIHFKITVEGTITIGGSPDAGVVYSGSSG